MNNPANKGRNGDSMLVHMSPAEVGGLAALAEQHGRSMTINPETGYPEAFSLGDILPTLVGLGATAMTGGAASPWLVGGLSGLTSYATTGSLEKGLMSGLTAGGLSSLGGSLAAEGAGAAAGAGNVAQSGTQQAIMSAAPKAAPAGLMGMDKAAQQAITPGMTSQVAPEIASQAPTQGFFDRVGSRFGDMGRGISSLMDKGQMGQFLADNQKPIMAAGMGIAGTAAINDEMRRREEMEKEREREQRGRRKDYMGSVNAIAQNYQDAGRPFTTAGLTGSKYYDPRMRNFKEGGLAESDKNQMYQDIALSYVDAGRDVPNYLQRYLPQNNKVQQAPRQFGMNITSIMGQAGQPWNNNSNMYQSSPTNITSIMGMNQNRYGPMYRGLEGLQGRNQNYKPQPFTRIQDEMKGPRQMVASPEQVLGQIAQGAQQVQQAQPAGGIANVSTTHGGTVANTDQILAQMNGKAQGGEIEGPGDGMSDDIMTSINGDTPAALSDGEFVIPADVVSHLGNGSSDAGAQVLYDMLDRVRQARTGSEKQGKQINPQKVMPV